VSERPESGSSSLRSRLRVEAARARAELAASSGFSKETYSDLVTRATELERTLHAIGATTAELSAIEDRRRTLESVARLLADRSAEAVPPTNDEAYAAALDIAELARAVATLRSASSTWSDTIRRSLQSEAAGAPDAAPLRLTIGFGAACRRARLGVRPADRGESCGAELDLGGWPVWCPSVVPDASGAWIDTARASVAAGAGPSIVVLEAGGLLPVGAGAARVAEDGTGVGLAAARVDALLAEHRDTWADALGTDLAFALVARATLPVLNVASGRVVLAECFRCVNLCSLDDPRADRLRDFARALADA
jgi:hypothetical protein